jgi:hypothetical protein
MLHDTPTQNTTNDHIVAGQNAIIAVTEQARPRNDTKKMQHCQKG